MMMTECTHGSYLQNEQLHPWPCAPLRVAVLMLFGLLLELKALSCHACSLCWTGHDGAPGARRHRDWQQSQQPQCGAAALWTPAQTAWGAVMQECASEQGTCVGGKARPDVCAIRHVEVEVHTHGSMPGSPRHQATALRCSSLAFASE